MSVLPSLGLALLLAFTFCLLLGLPRSSSTSFFHPLRLATPEVTSRCSRLAETPFRRSSQAFPCIPLLHIPFVLFLTHFKLQLNFAVLNSFAFLVTRCHGMAARRHMARHASARASKPITIEASTSGWRHPSRAARFSTACRRSQLGAGISCS